RLRRSASPGPGPRARWRRRTGTRATGRRGARRMVWRFGSPVDPPYRHAGFLGDTHHVGGAATAGERDHQFGAGIKHLAVAEYPGRLAVLAPVGRVRFFLDEVSQASPATRQEVSTFGCPVDDGDPADVSLAQSVQDIEHPLLVSVVPTATHDHPHRLERELPEERITQEVAVLDFGAVILSRREIVVITVEDATRLAVPPVPCHHPSSGLGAAAAMKAARPMRSDTKPG